MTDHRPESREAGGDRRTRHAVLLALTIVSILFVAAIRIRLLNFPLERDEGENAYMGQLLLQGVPPYRLAYDVRMPGTYMAFALIMTIFGQTVAGIHLGLLAVNMATTALVFLLARRIVNTSGALVAAATFSLLSVSPALLDMELDGEASRALSTTRYHDCVVDRLGATGERIFEDILRGMKLRY